MVVNSDHSTTRWFPCNGLEICVSDLLGCAPHGFPRHPEEATFRTELRAWLEGTSPRAGASATTHRADGREVSREWSKKLYEAGYAGLTWPKEYGGQGAPYTHQAIFLEETLGPRPPSTSASSGSAWRGRRSSPTAPTSRSRAHLAKILSGEEVWCQGFSEPGSGSDLASLRTKAEDRRRPLRRQRSEGVVVLRSHRGLLHPRRAHGPRRAQAQGHHLPARRHALAEGVEVRPLVQITGDPEFNEIFFNDVRVPKREHRRREPTTGGVWR